ncbi:morn domain repeat containing protein [Stylonychia lemnae]|uniref:Morn domain repeat containing protein n=1 Tax=Stylonychia lemnae TaxID=5949 RepID=A0A078A8V8_STYLE|nr:morn domain repeat containing protein [Stylonychia lemnae]|eukprot:CDW78710.1 morn domain repeat containing protein [Stylonychia lemnae]
MNYQASNTQQLPPQYQNFSGSMYSFQQQQPQYQQENYQVNPFSFFESQRSMQQMRMPSGYSAHYQNIQETLYYEPGDGEIFVYYDDVANLQKMVTCIDISTLFKEKRAKAIAITNFLGQVRNANIVQIYSHQIIDEKYVYIEMEVPQNLSLWKTFCKKKFMPDEVFNIIKQVGQGLEFLHNLCFTHRDVHPSRFQQFQNNVIKFNPIGLPYNFKKLLKRENFSGHINYSAPELILEKTMFSSKVDVWSLGCSLYYLVIKKDPFDGPDPNEIKRNILNLNLEKNQYMMIPMFLRPIIEACFILDENVRPTTKQLMLLLNQMQQSFKYQNQEPPRPIQNQQIPVQQMNSSNNIGYQQCTKIGGQNQFYPQQTMQMVAPSQLYQNINQSAYSPMKNQNNSVYSGSPIKQQIIPTQFTEFIPQSKRVSQSQNFNFIQRPQLSSDHLIDQMNQMSIGQYQHKNYVKSNHSSSLFDMDNTDKIDSYESKDRLTNYDSNLSEDPYNEQQFSFSPNSKQHQLAEDKLVFHNRHSQNEIKAFNDNEGNYYQGEVFNNQKHGQGKQMFANQSFYEGHWKNDLMDGYGKLVLTTGEIYIGSFVKGKRQGKGKLLIKPSGEVYEGDWKKDKMTGKGKYYYTNDKEFEGDFVEGAPYGFGIMKCPQYYYEGYFKSGLFEGQGKFIDKINNQVFECEYYDGKRRGKGKQINIISGDSFEGIWLEDKKNGPGVQSYKQLGYSIKGIWKSDEIETVNIIHDYHIIDDVNEYQF